MYNIHTVTNEKGEDSKKVSLCKKVTKSLISLIPRYPDLPEILTLTRPLTRVILYDSNIQYVRFIQMHHLKENCDCKTFHEVTGLCTLCARYNHEDFVRHFRNGTNPDDEHEQWLLDQLRNNPSHGLRIGTQRMAKCGHPGVYRGTTCAICHKIRKDARVVKTLRQSVNHVDTMRLTLEQLNLTINEIERQRETLKQAIQLAEMGLNIGNVTLTTIKMKTPRQIAIENGDRWYLPYEKCSKCGVLSERYVANGRCRNCGGK